MKITLQQIQIDRFQDVDADGRAFGWVGLVDEIPSDEYQGWFFTYPGEKAQLRKDQINQVIASLSGDAHPFATHNKPKIPHALAERALRKLLKSIAD